MKKGILLTLSLFFIIIIIIMGIVSAECQYKETINTGNFVNTIYDKENNKYTNPITIFNFINGTAGGSDCYAYFSISNNIDKTISLNMQYQMEQGSYIRYQEKSFNIIQQQTFLVNTNHPAITGYGCGIILDTISYQFVTNSETTAKVEAETIEVCKQCGVDNCLNDGDTCNYDFQCGSNVCSQTGNTAGHCITNRSDFEVRLYNLETWKDTITQAIANIWNAIAGQGATAFPNYFKYMSSAERKRVICGYASDNKMNNIHDLNFQCNMTYMTGSTGKVRATCKCKEDKIVIPQGTIMSVQIEGREDNSTQ